MIDPLDIVEQFFKEKFLEEKRPSWKMKQFVAWKGRHSSPSGAEYITYGRYLIYKTDGSRIDVSFGHHGGMDYDLTAEGSLQEMWDFVNHFGPGE